MPRWNTPLGEKKRGAVNCIVLHTVIYEAVIAGETGGVLGQSRQDPRTR